MAVIGLDHIQICMPPGREEDARAFYGALLEFTEVAKPAHLVARGGCWFKSVGVTLHLGIDKQFQPSRKGHPGLIVDNFNALRDRLRSAGYDVKDSEPTNGADRFFVDDSFGNRIEVMGRTA